MTNLVILLWIGNICCDTLGQIAFKHAATISSNSNGWRYWLELSRRPWLWIGIGAYVFEFLLWLAFLTLVQLSEGILLGSVNIVAIMIVGRLLFREKLTRLRIVGMLLVTSGVAIVGAF